MLERMFEGATVDSAAYSQRGYIEQVEVLGNDLVVAGWIGHENDGVLQTIDLEIDKTPLVQSQLIKMLPSPDVANVHPNISGAANCRFKIRAPLDVAGFSFRRENALVSITPRFERGVARTIFYPLNLTLPMPDSDLIEGIGGGYARVAFDYLGHFVQLGHLDDSDSILDVGCGCGRMAVALSLFLKDNIRYEGFDIVDEQVQWARQNISTRYPHFNFQRVNVFNKYYNPAGKLNPAGFVFPYDAESFDFAFLTSVFTHMQAPELQHYLWELHRVLKPGKTCFVTVFLLNEESRRLITQGKSSISLVHEGNGCMVADPLNPEGAVGFAEPDLFKWCEQVGFSVSSPRYGNWCGREKHVDYQDILILTK